MPTITIPDLFSTTAPYDRLPAPTVTAADVTITIDGVTSQTTNPPVVNPDGSVSIDLTDAEYLHGAKVKFKDFVDLDNGLLLEWLSVEVEILIEEPVVTNPLSRRHRQIAKAFERDLRSHAIPIAIVRNGFSDASCAIHTQPRYSSSDDEGFITTSNTEYFLMRRCDYRSASQVTNPKVGDRIIKTATGESFEVINDDDGKNLDDTQPEIDKLRIPVRRVAT